VPVGCAGEVALVRDSDKWGTVPLKPSHHQQLIGRRFAFHPPIRNIRHNVWALRRATGPELLIVHLRSGVEFAIQRSFVGALSHIEDPVIVVALRREMHYVFGGLVPVRRTVIELPLSVAKTVREPPHSGLPAPVVSIRTEPPGERRFAWRTSMVLLLWAVISVVMLGIGAQSQSRQQSSSRFDSTMQGSFR
jgi:hypothetical protein